MSTDVHTLSGAYALNALGPEEAAEFRRHLDGCQVCRDEVRELQRAAARMGAAEAVTPPPHLKGRILAAAERTPQEPPRASSGGVVGPSVPGQRRWVAWLAAAAAAVVVGGAGLVGWNVAQDDEPTLAADVAQVFEAEDARTATVEVDGGTVTVGVSASRNEMAVDTSGLPPLDEEHVYQVWSARGDQMVSAAILSDPEDGASMGMPPRGTQVALTVEPRGGSEQPTTDPIVQVDPYEVLEG